MTGMGALVLLVCVAALIYVFVFWYETREVK
jgi:hypothetical protein